MSRHLLVALSSHGFGHVAQAAPVVNLLRQRLPDLRVTLYTAAPEFILGSRLVPPYDHLAVSADVGAVMDSAFRVNVEATAAAYAAFHQGWDDKVAQEAERLRQLKPDLVFADVPYRVLAAAARVGIPAVALSSLNWAAIYRHYCAQRPEAQAIHAQIVSAYNAAEAFLCPAPSMPMPELRASRAIGPIVWPARPDPQGLRRRLGVGPDQRLVMIAMGGVPVHISADDWPQQPGTTFIVSAGWPAARPDFVSAESVDMHFSDVLASCDAVLTKPGYNTLVEAACQGVAVLYAGREDWPEQPHLLEWMARHARIRAISLDQLKAGALAEALAWLGAQPRPAPPEPTGTAEAAEFLAAALA